MHDIDNLYKQAPFIEARLGYTFHDKSLLRLAFIHRSFVNEHREVSEHNERLEFLGDSVLGIIIAEYLYRSLPENPEGELSYLRSRLVEATSCINFFSKLDIEKYILLGKGEKMNYGKGRESILADTFEAVIGAIYLDRGIDSARNFLFKNFSEEIGAIIQTPLTNWKAQLQDFCQKKFHEAPLYHVLSETGPDHSKVFSISVTVQNKEIGLGEGSSKKEAQQAAARNAFEKIQNEGK